MQVPRGDGTTQIRLRRGATLSDFAEKIDVNPASLVTVLFHLGEMATATQSLDEGTFELLGAELGYKIQIVSPEEEDRELLEDFNIDLDAELAAETDEDLEVRPPVVTVMGHVDHGKTRLLDAIRKSDVISGEAGGITQHIGAYQVHHEHEGTMRAITFIDTPGHEAFTAMRARGARVTDIAILVVAADDGVMPQTIEALNHAQAADVPIVVAVNKIDKPGANPEKVRQQLTEYNLVAEEYGGDTLFVNVSALKGEGVDEVLEAVLLTADAGLDLRANPDKDARGVAVEAHLDKGRGAVATVLVQSGTLRVGDSIVAGTAHGRVRAMFDEHDQPIEEATPARPVMVLGLQSVPRAGDSFLVADDERTARQIAEKREAADRAAQLAKRRKRISLEDFTEALAAGKVDTLNLIIKGDVSGAVEALEDALLAIDVGDEVELRVIHRGVGAVTQNDVNLATVDNAIIIGFNVRPAERVQELADREGVDMRFYSVIYRAIEDIEAALKGMLKPEFVENATGSAEIVEIFRSSKFGNIAGCMVRSGHHPPQREGPPQPRRRRRRRGHHRHAPPVQGRRHRGPRGLRVRYRARQVQRHPGGRHHRVLRDGRGSRGPNGRLAARASSRGHDPEGRRPRSRGRDQGPPPGLRHRDGRPRHRGHPARDGVLLRLRGRGGARRHGGRPRLRQRAAPFARGRRARDPAHAEPRVRPGRRAGDRRDPREGASRGEGARRADRRDARRARPSRETPTRTGLPRSPRTKPPTATTVPHAR